MHGASHEGGKRAGTENIPYAVALGKACELCSKALQNGTAAALLWSLRQQLWTQLEQSLPDAELRVNGPLTGKYLVSTISQNDQLVQ